MQAQRVALYIHTWLYPPSSEDLEYHWNRRHYEWLQEFFKDEPEWELRLKEWINLIQHVE